MTMIHGMILITGASGFVCHSPRRPPNARRRSKSVSGD